MPLPEINADMLVSDLVAAYPDAISILADRNLHCIICGEPVWGTIGELARDKHFDSKEIAKLIADLKAKASGMKIKS